MDKLDQTPGPMAAPRSRPASTKCVESILGFLIAIPLLFCFSSIQQWAASKPALVDDLTHSPLAPPSHESTNSNTWSSILPSPNLTWTSCYTDLHPSFQCARLSLPMNPDHPVSSSNKVDIALVLLPATVTNTTTTTPPKRPLLVNPGGPGGSGALIALLLAPSLQVILGADQPILGFDPRGIGESRPVADCWETSSDSCPGGGGRQGADGGRRGCGAQLGLKRRMEWMDVQSAFGTVATSGGANLRFLVQGERGVNALCSSRYGKGSDILRFSGTRFVAGDMVGIVDAWDRATGEEVEGEGKLAYWGFSYGTYLGQVFAGLFPERVGRVMLDGVVDADLYESDAWMESLYDAEKVVGWFCQTCVEAGEKCALFREGDGAEDVQKRYRGIVERLDEEPVSFTHPKYEFPVLLRPETVRIVMFKALYSPIQAFPALAAVLNVLHEERWEEVSAMFDDLEALCNWPVASFPLNFVAPNDAQRAVMCSDKANPVNLTATEIQDLYSRMAKYSDFADFWMQLTLTCNGWDLFPKTTGLQTMDKTKPVKTHHPLLFLSTTIDPVTPLLAAVKMALRFEDAGLLEVKCAGHATISAPSRCSAKIMRDYLLDGKLPPPPVVEGDDYLGGKWTKCDADMKPWGSMEEGEFQAARVDEAWARVRGTLDRMPRWGVEGDISRMVMKKSGLSPGVKDMVSGWSAGAGVGAMEMDEFLRGF